MKRFLKSEGGSVQALVLARMKRRSTTPGNKPPPVSLRIKICSESAEIRQIVPKGDPPKQYELKNGESYWYGAWDPRDNVQPGSLIVLVNPCAKMYNGEIRVNGSATLIKPASYETFHEHTPLSLFELPEQLNGLETKENVVLNFLGWCGKPSAVHEGGQRPVAYTEGMYENMASIYTMKNRDGELLKGAYMADFGGYPVEIQKYTTDVFSSDGFIPDGFKVLASVKFYDNNFTCFGIANIDAWMVLAPLLLDELVGYMLAYVDPKHTKQLVGNLAADDGAVGSGPSYVVGLSCTCLQPNLPVMLSVAGFRVTKEYVKEYLNNVSFVESNFAEKNQLWKDREQGKVINLMEYTGELAKFYEPNAWKFYVLVDYYHIGAGGARTTYTSEELAALRSATSTDEDRAAALKNKTKMHYSTLYIYACKA